MKFYSVFGMSIVSLWLLGACQAQAVQGPIAPVDPKEPPVLAIVNGVLIDGTGAGPIADGVVLLQGDQIVAVGKRSEVTIPAGARLLDVGGATILPGFINSHVHGAFDPGLLEKWAKAGVTTVRDEGLLASPGQAKAALKTALTSRGTLFNQPHYARIISAGIMMTVPNGYGNLEVSSVEEARSAVLDELKSGADLIKISLEDGYAGQRGLPKLTSEQISAIIETAHQQGVRVSGHITQAAYLEQLAEAGVDDIGHTPYDHLSDDAIAVMVEKGIYMNTTFSVLKAYNALGASLDNLARFVEAGGKAAMGSDYGGGPGAFEDGMPMFEILTMQKAGLDPMQIIVISTQHAAEVCGLGDTLGTLEPGKQADVLVVRGNPLEDLNTLTQVKLVIHGGEIIVE